MTWRDVLALFGPFGVAALAATGKTLDQLRFG